MQASAASCTSQTIDGQLFKRGELTVATDSPAYPPWFDDNEPANGRGFESAVAYAIAKELGFSRTQVHWVVEHFDNSYLPGPKPFDFDINEISYTPQRAQSVTFSTAYYDVGQALVALKSGPIVDRHAPNELRGYVYGDQTGSTSLDLIYSELRPFQQPLVLGTLNAVKSALDRHRIQALVTDTPTAVEIASSEVPGSVVVGQFLASNDYYALLFAKNNPLVGCVNWALGKLRSDGALSHFEHESLSAYTRVPTIVP